MLPDLRPSMPLSTGPTLFLAPSPIAWQARHLLNDVLPAAASCAIGAGAVAVTGRVVSTAKIRFVIVFSSSLPWWVWPGQSFAWPPTSGPAVLGRPPRLEQATK